MFRKKTCDASFYGVALLLILAGAAILAYGIVGWLFNFFGSAYTFVFPSLKIIGGLVVLALGYIHLEIELLRKQD